MITTIAEKNYTSTSPGTIFFNTAGLTDEVKSEVMDYYQNKFNNLTDIVYWDDMKKIALYKTIEYGFLDLFFYDISSDNFLFNEGYFHTHVHSLIKNYLHRLNENHSREAYPVYINENIYNIEMHLVIYNSRHYVIGAIVQEMHHCSETLKLLEKFFSRFYLNQIDHENILYEYSYDSRLNSLLKNFAEKTSRENRSLHYVLIEIEPLKKYIKVAGDFLVNEIIKNVQELILEIIKDQGQCYILNSRQYLITVSGMDESTIKEKLGRAHFRIKNLLLIHQMKYTEVKDFENGYTIENIWPALMIK